MLAIMGQRHTVFLTSTPLHLFWTTGVYYLWELAEDFRVVLIVEEQFGDDPAFKEAISKRKEVEVVYLPSALRRMARHRDYVQRYRKIARRFQPVFALVYGVSYVENGYLVQILREECPRCRIVSYQNGRLAMDWKTDFVTRRAPLNRRSDKRISLSRLKSRLVRRAEDWRWTVANYYVGPIATLGRPLLPPVNLRTGAINGRRMSGAYDFFFTYLEVERNMLRSLHGTDHGLTQVRHPLETSGDACHRALYTVGEEKLVSLLPSWGFPAQLAARTAQEHDAAALDIASRWLEVVEILSVKLPGYRFAWKLHPAAAGDPISQKITEHMQGEVPGLEVAPPGTSAQQLIIRSRVVVVDVSTVFWWTGFLGGKVVISLDVFGFPGGDEAKHYNGVVYVNDMNQLRAITLKAAIGREDPSRERLPSVADFIKKALSSG